MTMPTPPTPQPAKPAGIAPVLLVASRLAKTSLSRYLWGGLLWALFLCVPILTGLVLKALFDQLSGQRPATLEASLWLCGAFVVVELCRGLVLWVALIVWPYWWNAAETTLRANMLRSILTARGPAASRLPHTSGEAVSRFRDDVHDLTIVADNTIDLFGALIFGVIAFIIMALIDPMITLVLVLPLTVVLVLTRALNGVIRRIHKRARELGAEVTAYIGEMFSGVLAIKTAGAEDAVLARLREHNRRRRKAAVKDRLAMDLLDTATSSTIELSIGLVLLLAAPAMRRGDFTVGDLALFTSYVGWLTMLPRVLGKMLYRVPQGAVATDRLTRLMAEHEDADDLAKLSGVWFDGEEPPAVQPALAGRADRLEVLEARGLTVLHGGTGRGVRDVDLRVERGSFTVLTGAVGAGKTTLVRALLGLLPVDTGSVSWNGSPVDDPGTFLVPDRASYAGQVPRLFSESLRENLLLGWPASEEELTRVLTLAALEQDLAEMPAGLETVVGPRGVRLSGGQVQRATAARALVRSPDLLVVDDLSSALDVETEHLLWDRIATAARDGRGPDTLLVISHRRAALERADQVVVLDRGQLVGTGSLDELLRTCPEMRRLWTEELVVEAEEELPQPDYAPR